LEFVAVEVVGLISHQMQNLIELSLEQTKKYKESLAKRRGETIDSNNITTAMSIYQLSPVGVKVLD
jgi:hypothetical protein